MKYRPLGRTGVQVSSIGIGTATLGVAPLAEAADALVGRAIDLGINLFDTANSYGNQARFNRAGAPLEYERASAEEILGKALGSRRKDVILCSKVREPVGAGPNDAGLSRSHIFKQIETTLRRLRTDYLDVYHAHHPDDGTPIDETVRAMSDLVRDGKIRYFALSTFNAWKMTEVLWASDRAHVRPPVCNQIAYNVLNRDAELDIIPACLKFGLTITAFGPLGGGLLAGEKAFSRPIAGDKRWGYSGFSSEQLDQAKAFNAIAAASGFEPAALALAWLIERPSVSAALVGPETVAELEVCAASQAIDMTPALREQIDKIAPPIPRSWY